MDPIERPEARAARFDVVVGEVAEPVRRYLARRTDPDTAEDVLAETLLVCWRRLDDVPAPAAPEDDGSPVVAWAVGVARHCLDNATRGDRRRWRLLSRVRAVDPPLGRAPAADAAYDDDAAARRVTAALATLRPAEAEVLRLWAWDGLGPSQVARVLGVSPNAASIRLLRAKQRLREALAQPGPDGTGDERSDAPPDRSRVKDAARRQPR